MAIATEQQSRKIITDGSGRLYADIEAVVAIEDGDEAAIKNLCRELEDNPAEALPVPDRFVAIAHSIAIRHLLPLAIELELEQACRLITCPGGRWSHDRAFIPYRLRVKNLRVAELVAGHGRIAIFKGLDFAITADDLIELGLYTVGCMADYYRRDIMAMIRGLSVETRYKVFDSQSARTARFLLSSRAISSEGLDEFCDYVRARHPEGLPLCESGSKTFMRQLSNPKAFALYRLTPKVAPLPSPIREQLTNPEAKALFEQLAVNRNDDGSAVYRHLRSSETITVTSGEGRGAVMGHIALLSAALGNYQEQLKELDRLARDERDREGELHA